MLIKIKVKTRAKTNKIEKVQDTENNLHKSTPQDKDIEEYLVSVKALPVKNKANEEIFKILSKYFKVPKSNIKILRGEKNKQKTIEITN
ncbi:MAG: DUF167 domain-containing protein [Candidatus Pacebacteria bacterium]|nr:DUF167 domain-containing protein [Candidatus Paceibacterota bacterium]MCF7862709.1 DUF167 domain-containing protein [Candidatus Paceibacterota bacterium]